MTYFADLTPYVYLRSAVDLKARNVGWLDGTHAFLQWNPAPRFVSALRELMQTARVHQTRGCHFCDLCSLTESDGIEERRGNCEIQVVAEDGEVFLAPSLIHHYVTMHGYRPPELFVNAVLFQASRGHR